jgi:hypothetical protein
MVTIEAMTGLTRDTADEAVSMQPPSTKGVAKRRRAPTKPKGSLKVVVANKAPPRKLTKKFTPRVEVEVEPVPLLDVIEAEPTSDESKQEEEDEEQEEGYDWYNVPPVIDYPLGPSPNGQPPNKREGEAGQIPYIEEDFDNTEAILTVSVGIRKAEVDAIMMAPGCSEDIYWACLQDDMLQIIKAVNTSSRFKKHKFMPG